MTNEWNEREVRQAFYRSKPWRDLRAYLLSQSPFCIRCRAEGYWVPATIVDHIQDIQDAPDLRLEIDNMQCLCVKCHNRKTAKTFNSKRKDKGKLQQINLWKL